VLFALSQLLATQGRVLNPQLVSTTDVFIVKRRLLSRVATWFSTRRTEVAGRTGGSGGGMPTTPGAWALPAASYASSQDKLRVACYMIFLRDLLCHLCSDVFCHPVLTSLVDDDMWSILTPAILRMFLSFSGAQVRRCGEGACSLFGGGRAALWLGLGVA
jgi:hypothetical protein